MSTVGRVPETSAVPGEELGAEDAWRTARRAGSAVWSAALRRFRRGDATSHSRALGLQLALAFLPLVIALVGLSGELVTERAGEVLRRTLINLAPSESGRLLGELLARPLVGGDDGSDLALWLGLVAALPGVRIRPGGCRAPARSRFRDAEAGAEMSGM